MCDYTKYIMYTRWRICELYRGKGRTSVIYANVLTYIYSFLCAKRRRRRNSVGVKNGLRTLYTVRATHTDSV